MLLYLINPGNLSVEKAAVMASNQTTAALFILLMIVFIKVISMTAKMQVTKTQ